MQKSRGSKFGISTAVLVSLLHILQIAPSSLKGIDAPKSSQKLLTSGIAFSSVHLLFDFSLVPSVPIFEQLFTNLQQITNTSSTLTTRVRNEVYKICSAVEYVGAHH